MQIFLSTTVIHCCPVTVYWALMNTEPDQHTFLLSFAFKHFFIFVLIETRFSSLFEFLFYLHFSNNYIYLKLIILFTASGCNLFVVVDLQEIISPLSLPLLLWFLSSALWLESLSTKRKQVREKNKKNIF